MNRYILQRLTLVIPTIIGASLLTFMLIRLLPGDIVDILMGGDRPNRGPAALRDGAGRVARPGLA
jgi:peptide/nickel transport system permease protein